jgi:hypothetical protein
MNPNALVRPQARMEARRNRWHHGCALGTGSLLTHNLDRILVSCYAGPEDVGFSDRASVAVSTSTKPLQPFNALIVMFETLELGPFAWRQLGRHDRMLLGKV